MVTGAALWTLIIGFLVLLICSIGYSGKKQYLGANLMLVFVSYAQGVILAILFYSDTIFNLFSTSILLGIVYYLLLSRFTMLFEFAVYKLTRKTPATLDPELTKTIARFWGIPEDKIHISIYIGEKSNNAFRKASFRFVDIYVGDEFRKNVSNDEMIFTLSHEVAHTRNHRDFAYPFVFAFVYGLLSNAICLALILTGILNVPVFFAVTVVLFIGGIIAINYLSWRMEFKADRLGAMKTLNPKGGIDLLKRFSASQIDRGTILNLIFYDHPLPRDRIIRLQNLSNLQGLAAKADP